VGQMLYPLCTHFFATAGTYRCMLLMYDMLLGSKVSMFLWGICTFDFKSVCDRRVCIYQWTTSVTHRRQQS
jgi:hypothetical protein